MGVVIQDHNGFIIASLTQQISQALQPLKLEAIAVARALEFGHETGITEVVLKGDSTSIIEPLKVGGKTIASVEPLNQDAIALEEVRNPLLYVVQHDLANLATQI